MLNGIGRVVDSSGDISEGLWKDGMLNGYARKFNSDGTYMIGLFRDNEPDGEMLQKLDSGIKEKVKFVRGRKV